eukprot:1103341-Amphidinium_carterae.1
MRGPLFKQSLLKLRTIKTGLGSWTSHANARHECWAGDVVGRPGHAMRTAAGMQLSGRVGETGYGHLPSQPESPDAHLVVQGWSCIRSTIG